MFVGTGALIGAAAGAVFGNITTRNTEEKQNKDQAAEAKKVARCKEEISQLPGESDQKRKVWINQIPEAMRNDCDLAFAIQVRSDSYNSERDSDWGSLPEDFELIRSEERVLLRLPSPAQFSERIDQLETKSADISQSEIVAGTIELGVVGFVLGGIGGVLAGINDDSKIENEIRRQYAGSSPPR